MRSLRAEDPEEAAVPLALAGDSAGGHIALESALRLAAADETVAHVAVLYPVISAACNSDSMRVFGEGHMLTREAMRWFWECYLGEGAESAARTTDLLQVALGALPPVTLVTAGCDPLRDEGERFARRLAQSGVRVASRRYPGMIHGFAGLPQLTDQAAEVLSFLGGALAAALVRTPAVRSVAVEPEGLLVRTDDTTVLARTLAATAQALHCTLYEVQVTDDTLEHVFAYLVAR